MARAFPVTTHERFRMQNDDTDDEMVDVIPAGAATMAREDAPAESRALPGGGAEKAVDGQPLDGIQGSVPVLSCGWAPSLVIILNSCTHSFIHSCINK